MDFPEGLLYDTYVPIMRLDKYLKVSRILKRRTVANELASNGRVSVNGKTAKPSADVDVGDEIEVFFGNRRMKVRILKISDSEKKSEAAGMYEVLEESYEEWKETL